MKLINLMFDLVLHDHDAVVAALLPFFNATLTVPRTVGVTLIVLGVVTINFRHSCDNGNNSDKELSR
jgi:undecaprenyl phosphate-alpha-L-ara4N flippase subunit ArnF